MNSNDSKTDPRTDFAERMPAFGPDTEILKGQAARDALTSLLDGAPAVGGEPEVTRRLRRGRPALNPAAPAGHRARQLNVRVSEDDYALFARAVEVVGAKNDSDLVRTALQEYFTNHQISA